MPTIKTELSQLREEFNDYKEHDTIHLFEFEGYSKNEVLHKLLDEYHKRRWDVHVFKVVIQSIAIGVLVALAANSLIPPLLPGLRAFLLIVAFDISAGIIFLTNISRCY
jgi:hypothetical protein